MKKNLFKGKYFVGGVDDKVHFEIEVKMFFPADEQIPNQEEVARDINRAITNGCEKFVEHLVEDDFLSEALDYLQEDDDEYIDLSMDTEVWTSEREEVELVDV